MGPRQVGKTTLTKQLIDERWTYITFDDQAQLALARADPLGFIRNLPTERVVLDEVQKLPEIFVSIKQFVDENRQPGRFLLTGSANALLLPRLSDSLAGRMEAVRLTTLSECEIRHVQPLFLNTCNYSAQFSFGHLLAILNDKCSKKCSFTHVNSAFSSHFSFNFA
jgi:uncharacterized protein